MKEKKEKRRRKEFKWEETQRMKEAEKVIWAEKRGKGNY